MNRLWLVACIGIFLAACGSGKKSYMKKGEIDQTMDVNASGNNYFEAVGIGAPIPEATSTAQRKATSKNAAVEAARYEMLAMLMGVELEGGIRVEKAVETDSVLQSNVKAVSRGAEITKVEWDKDDGCVVTMRIPKKRAEQMMGVKFKK
jgi:hypothetical protein